jgi:CHAT domain-containing protein
LACDTAVSRTSNLQDEVITLTSAFQVAGFARVVGTLWKAEDSMGFNVAIAFYEELRGDMVRSAEALHSVVSLQRDKFRDQPSMWALCFAERTYHVSDCVAKAKVAPGEDEARIQFGPRSKLL